MIGVDSADLTNSTLLFLDCSAYSDFFSDFRVNKGTGSLCEIVDEGLKHFEAGVSHIQNELDCPALLDELKSELWYRDQMNIYVEPSRPPRQAKAQKYNQLSTMVLKGIQHMFRCEGDPDLYSHQADALDALLGGHHLSLSTSTASGKSLVFIAFGVDKIIKNPHGTVLAIYPTKALAQNQLLKWREFISVSTENSATPISCDVIDGDTEFKIRRDLISRNTILLTNFDFIHKTMALWKQLDFIRRLQFIVIDEAHVCRGIFGAHAALTLRRLLLLHRYLKSEYMRRKRSEHSSKHPRLSEEVRGNLQLMTASATLGNPKQHFNQLTGQDCVAVSEDGSPSAEKYFILWSPQKAVKSSTNKAGPVVPLAPVSSSTENKAQGGTEGVDLKFDDQGGYQKQSAIQDALKLFVFFVKRNVRTFLFCNARSLVEVIFNEAQQKVGRIVNYRGGYVKESRRELERKMFCHEVMGVVTTNALELGIDLGFLDVVITLGFEGSVSSVKQRLGRAGRSDNRASIGFLVAFDSPVESYICNILQERFWSRPPENVGLNTNNVLLVKQHLLCALKEINTPINHRVILETFGTGGEHKGVEAALQAALESGEVREVAPSFFKFAVTSKKLILFEGKKEQEDVCDIDELYDRLSTKREVKTEQNRSDRPADHPYYDMENDDPEELFPFLNRSASKQGDREEGLTTADLKKIVEQSEVKVPLDEKPMNEQRRCISVQDVLGANDPESRCAFREPHQLVDLRASAIPNVTVYIIGKVESGRMAAHASEQPDVESAVLAGRIINHGNDLSSDIIRGGTPVDEVEMVNSFMTLFPGAVYPYRGVKYIVKEFVPTRLYAILEKPRNIINYYTKAGDSTHWSLLALSQSFDIARLATGVLTARIFCGDLKVRVTVPHYYKIQQKGTTPLEKVKLNIPDLSFVTRGLAIRFDQNHVWLPFKNYYSDLGVAHEMLGALMSSLLKKSIRLTAGLYDSTYLPTIATHGLGHILTKLLTTTVWCDIKEIACSCTGAYAQIGKPMPKVYVYERASGLSLGIIDALSEEVMFRTLQDALQTCEACGCYGSQTLDGCLDCVLLPTCSERNQLVSHAATILLLRLMLQGVSQSNWD